MTRCRISTREHTCAQCGERFVRKYNISAGRAARPQLCSRECQSLFITASRRNGVSARFWAMVQKGTDDECWVWLGHRRPWGYGWFNGPEGPTNAHRIAYLLSNGEIPEGLVVCHSCDNPPCCNPAHLWVGTVRDNVQDMIRKGRDRRNPRLGAYHHNAKLSPEIVRAVMSSTESNSALAARYGVTATAVYNIRHGKAWRHVTGAVRAS